MPRGKKSNRALKSCAGKPDVADVWTTLTTKRADGPPLRFKGQKLAHHHIQHARTTASITLWRRKTKGFVAAVDVAGRVHSGSSPTLDDLMDWLEHICQPEPFAAAYQTDDAQGHRTAQSAVGHRLLRCLAGEALDHWDQLADTEKLRPR